MSTNLDRVQRERLRHRQGRALLGRDFRRGVTLDDQARWWHNRAVHNAYGVAYGLELAGNFGPQQAVLPGVAYDCFGRELWLQRFLMVPPAPPEEKRPALWTLLLRWRPGSGLAGAGRSCAAPEEMAELVWKRAREVEIADGVPLARITVIAAAAGTRYLPDPDFRRPYARAVARPRVGYGATVQGKTGWLPWISPMTGIGHGIEVTIDTSSSGFERTPCYFAWLQGLQPRLAKAGLPILLDRIVDASPSRFTFSLWGPRRAGFTAFAFQDFGLLELARHFLGVCWLGLEMPGDRSSLQEVDHVHS